jgi:hypothetical protein
MLKKGNVLLKHESPTWKHLNSSQSSLIPMKKGTFWKVTMDTIDTKNEQPFNYHRLKLKCLDLPLWI